MKKYLRIIFCIILSLSIVCSFAGCNKDGKSQSDDENEEDENVTSESADVDISTDFETTSVAEEIEFLYLSLFYNTYNTAQYYNETYGDGYGKMFTGYDTSLAPDEQTTKNNEGETITFAAYFYEQAISQMASLKYYHKLAVDTGIILTAEDDEEVEKLLAEFKENNYLKSSFDVEFSDELLKNIISMQIYFEKYEDFIREQCADKTEVLKDYSSEKEKYDVVAFRWFTIDIESKASGGVYEEESEAAAFIEKVTSVQNYNEETFKKVVLETVGKDNKNYEAYKADQTTKIEKIDKDTIEIHVSQAAADWLYETDDNGNYVRQSGEMKYFVSSDKTAVYILYATGTPFRDETKATDVRHILLMDSTYQDAQNILNEYLADAGNGVDEEFFIELVSKYSDDSGSKNSGGLIDNMLNDGQYVSAFEDWAFSEGEFAGEKREYGSTGIVESEYGYHIMFYAGCDKNPGWYEEIVDEKCSAEINTISAAIDAEELIGKEITVDTKEAVIKNCLEAISKMK